MNDMMQFTIKGYEFPLCTISFSNAHGLSMCFKYIHKDNNLILIMPSYWGTSIGLEWKRFPLMKKIKKPQQNPT